MRNADGYGTFTAPNQPYFHYNEILDWLSNRSPARRWKWTVRPGVRHFFFEIGISAPYVGEPEPVPAIPPDLIPDSLLEHRNVDSVAPWGPSIRDVVTVQFKLGTSQADRQAAVDAVGGVVVGGLQLLGPDMGNDGAYLVKISGDSTRVAWKHAWDQLAAMPQVLFAQPELILRGEQTELTMYPNDGFGFERHVWKVNPDSAARPFLGRWGLEAIAAPSAWACNVGESEGNQVNIAIEDAGFFVDDQDIAPNIAHQEWDAVKGDHGLAVASVLGAVGNNDRFMTGVMQRANLGVYDIYAGRSFAEALLVGPPMLFRYRAYIRAVKSGAPVVNISLGINWLKTSLNGMPHLPDPANPLDSLFAKIYAAPYVGYTNLLEQRGFRPLLVLAAGNENIDAWWTGTPQLANHFPSRTLVVGAASRFAPGGGPNGNGYGRWASIFPNSASNGGVLVDIMAPGDRVETLTYMESAFTKRGRTGTSFAAPMVSGVAGLLSTGNRTLKAEDLRTAILEGARIGGRLVPADGASTRTTYLVNAHESLRYAAEKLGSPPCGNPIWQDPTTGTVYARRGTGTNFRDGATDALFTAPLGSDLSPLQGNRVIRVGTTGYRKDSLAWAVRGTFPASPGDNASNLSREGKAFGGDSVATVLKEVVTSGAQRSETFIVQLNGREVWRVTPPPVRWEIVLSTCVKWLTGSDPNSQCDQYASTWNARVNTSSWHALSPQGDRIILVVNRDSSATVVDSTGSAGGYQFRYHHLTEETKGATVYVLQRSSPGGSWSKLHEWTWSIERIERPALSPDGVNFGAGLRAYAQYVNFVPDGTQYGSVYHNCSAMYANASRSFRHFLPTETRRNLSNMSPCYPNLTFAP